MTNKPTSVHFGVPALIAMLALPFAPAAANEHLLPEDSQFTRAALPAHATSLAPYHEKIVTVLADAFDDDIRARLVAMPSYSPEYAVGIRLSGGRYAIFHIQSSVQLWSYEHLRMLKEVPEGFPPPSERSGLADAIEELESRLPSDYHDVTTVSRCDYMIETDLGEDLVRLWELMLLETRYDEPIDLGPDGTDYHFSMISRGRLMAGKIWNPPPDSKTGALVSITDTMKNLCLTGDQNLVAQLEPQVRALLQAFQPQPQQ